MKQRLEDISDSFVRKNSLTLTQLAFKLDLDSANLSKIENRKQEFDEKRLDKLAVAFNLDMEKLKIEYFGDQFTKIMYAYNCSSKVLVVAEEKMNYLNNKNVVQGEINFDNKK